MNDNIDGFGMYKRIPSSRTNAPLSDKPVEIAAPHSAPRSDGVPASAPGSKLPTPSSKAAAYLDAIRRHERLSAEIDRRNIKK